MLTSDIASTLKKGSTLYSNVIDFTLPNGEKTPATAHVLRVVKSEHGDHMEVVIRREYGDLGKGTIRNTAYRLWRTTALRGEGDVNVLLEAAPKPMVPHMPTNNQRSSNTSAGGAAVQRSATRIVRRRVSTEPAAVLSPDVAAPVTVPHAARVRRKPRLVTEEESKRILDSLSKMFSQ